MLMELPKTPIVNIHTTENRGFTPEEIAKRCSDKIIEVGDNASPEIRDQAIAFKQRLEKVIAFYMKEAIKSDRTTIYNAIKDAGQEQLAEHIRRL
jgi:major membrane immunogen (membrane-anchored lipoprotein)|tara:strand:- start:341 stop:625 length:285 start_codon:yes stop_codon:yes gene_type:complete